MQGAEEDTGLSGKVALISGGGAAGDGIGNGRAAAVLLARADAKVLVADLNLKLAERTVEMIAAEGGTAAALACDATKEADCKKLIEAAVDRFGRLDFLDNNVGIGSRGSVVDEKRSRPLISAPACSFASPVCVRGPTVPDSRRHGPAGAAGIRCPQRPSLRP